MLKIKAISILVWEERYKVFRFLVSGGSATAIDFILLYTLTEWGGVYYLKSAILAFMVSVCVSFVLQKFWTFQDHSRDGIKQQAFVYLAMALVNVTINTMMIYLLVESVGLHYLLAQFLSSILIALESYFIYHHLIFKSGPKALTFSVQRQWFLFGLLLIIFIGLRLPGLDLPYHQDEMKTALISSAGTEALEIFHHPPLTQLIYKAESLTLGPDHFRLFVLLFSIISFFLVVIIAKQRLGWVGAIFSLFFLTITFYSVHASLNVDTDGAILPVFFLLVVYFYDRAYATIGRQRSVAIGLTGLFLLIGLLTKLSFILVVGAIVLDILYRERARLTGRLLIKTIIALGAGLVVFGGLLLAIKTIYPIFSIGGMVAHTKSFINFSQRGWLQILIQFIKVIFYFSPLVLILPFLINREIYTKTRVFFFYLVLGFIFYFILFDFSQGALDKYLMFAVVPLAIISGAVAASIWLDGRLKREQGGIGLWLGIGGGLLMAVLALLPHKTIALYPKTIWFSNALHFKWTMLFPLTGGSGPLGFYMSFLFIMTGFLLSLIIGLVAFFKKDWRYSALLALLVISTVYNIVFISEFSRGGLYGSAPQVLKKSLAFIKNTQGIDKVITYNDAGGYELHRLEKYGGRFYAVPAYADANSDKFKKSSGYFLIIDIPKLNEEDFYGQFFAKCQTMFESKSGEITGRVYNCIK